MSDVTTPKPPAREVRSLRLLPGGIAAIQELADREGMSWDDMTRLLLSWATYKFEPGWTKAEPGLPSPDGVTRPSDQPW